jgi:hypothetical protein
MFKLMGRIQNWVLTIAGVATAGLFGITATDIQGCIQSSAVRKAEVSSEERNLVLKNLRIGSILNDTSVPNDQLEEVIQDYVSRLRQAQTERVAVSDHELGLFLHQQFGGKEEYRKFTTVIEQRFSLPVGEVESFYRDRLLFRKLSQMSMLPIYVTRSEILNEYHLRNDEWVVDQILADSSLMIPPMEPSEEELNSWFEDHSFEEQFRIPERVVVEYLMVNPESLEIPAAEDLELREFYNQNRDKYPSDEYEGETRPFFEVLDTLKEDYLKDSQKALAKRMLDVLDIQLLRQESPDFEGLLKTETKNDPKLSSVVYGKSQPFSQRDFRIDPLGYVFNLSQRVFGANPRNYGGVLEAGNGLYIYRVIDRQEEGMMDFNQARLQVVDAVQIEKKSKMALESLETSKEAIIASGNWANLELVQGLSYQRKDLKGGFSQEGQLLADLKLGDTSPISPLGSNYTILKVVERKPADESLLEEQKESLKQSILRTKFSAIQELTQTAQ